MEQAFAWCKANRQWRRSENVHHAVFMRKAAYRENNRRQYAVWTMVLELYGVDV